MGIARTLWGNHCVVHKRHIPTPWRTVYHHVKPLEYGGPDVTDNLVGICDTGHYNLHEYIAAHVWNVRHPAAPRPLPKLTRAEAKLAGVGAAQADLWLAAHPTAVIEGH